MTERAERRLRYCIHADYVVSRNDGDRHYVSAPQLAHLYELKSSEWYVAPALGHRDEGRCLYPRFDGRYGRPS